MVVNLVFSANLLQDCNVDMERTISLVLVCLVVTLKIGCCDYGTMENIITDVTDVISVIVAYSQHCGLFGR